MNGILRRRSFLRTAVAGAAAWPFLPSGRLLAAASLDPVLLPVNPELRPHIEQVLPSLLGQRAPGTNQRADAALYAMIYKPSLPDVPVQMRRIAGARGHPDVTVFVVNGGPKGRRPAILHMHGGGFVAGTAEASVASLQRLCKALDCVVVTVDYRLAPQTTYRGSIEDNYAGLRWIYRNAAELGVDPNRIAVMGESAGGGHAALLAIAARDRGEVPLAFQCLVYPMLDDRTGSSRQVPSHVGRLVWTAERNRYGWKSFLGMEPGGEAVPGAAVPARVDKLTGLPPTFVGVGSIDLFHDESVDYAQRLNAAGVRTELIVVPGAFHGFDLFAQASKLVQRFEAAKLVALRAGLGLAG
jgi:acetyl esterase/lipase